MSENEEKILQALDQISSRADLVKLVEVLSHDLKTNPESWENPSLERFLEALGAYLSANMAWDDKADIKQIDMRTWKVFGKCLCAARIYE